MNNYAIFVEEQDNEDVENRVFTTLGIQPNHADRAMDDPIDTFAGKDELSKELPTMRITPQARAAAVTAIQDGKMPLRDFLALLRGKDQGELSRNKDPLPVTDNPVGFLPGGGTAEAPSPM